MSYTEATPLIISTGLVSTPAAGNANLDINVAGTDIYEVGRLTVTLGPNSTISDILFDGESTGYATTPLDFIALLGRGGRAFNQIRVVVANAGAGAEDNQLDADLLRIS